jgi:hypothetical protein
MANKKKQRQRRRRVRAAAAPPIVAPADEQPAWEWPKELAKPDGPIALIDQVQYAIGQLYAIKKPDQFDRQLAALETKLLPRLELMVHSGSNDVALRAAEAAIVLRRCHTARQEAAVRYGEQAMKALATLEIAKLQMGSGGSRLGSEEFAGVLQEILPPVVEAVWDRIQKRVEERLSGAGVVDHSEDVAPAVEQAS